MWGQEIAILTYLMDLDTSRLWGEKKKKTPPFGLRVLEKLCIGLFRMLTIESS